MNTTQALETARQIAGESCTLTIHQGAIPRDQAVRITGTFKEAAVRIGWEIAEALPGKFVADGGFVAVWF